MSIKIKQEYGRPETVATVLEKPLFTPEQAERMLRGLMKMVSINPTPGLMRRWADGQKEAGIVCPECSGDWDAWVVRETRRKEEGLLPWESW